MMLLLSLLFLPATVSGPGVSCWSTTGSGWYKETIIAYAIQVRASGVYPEMGNGRPERKSTRLASRLGLFCCPDVDGAGLLFLPALDGKYVSVWTRTAEAVKASVGMRAAKVTVSVDSGVYLQALARQSRFLVRLASREDCPLWCRC